MKVYVASSIFNASHIQPIIHFLREKGIEITYDWTVHGQVFDEAQLEEVGKKEYAGVVECDVLFMVFPARNGSHCELGIALALNKPVIILLDRVAELKPFYFLPAVTRFQDEGEALSYLLSLENK